MILLLRTPSSHHLSSQHPPPLLDLPCHHQTYVFLTTVSALVGFPLRFGGFHFVTCVANRAFVARGRDLMDSTLVGPMTHVWGDFMDTTPVGPMIRVGGFLGVRLSLVMEWDELSEEALLPYPDRRDSHAPLCQKKKLMAGSSTKTIFAPCTTPIDARVGSYRLRRIRLWKLLRHGAIQACLVATEGSFSE